MSKTNNNLAELGFRCAEAGLGWEIRVDDEQSIMPPGRNGPYFDLESPIRNSAHWLSTFAIAYAISGDNRFSDVGKRLSNFIMTNTLYQVNGIMVHRQKPSKDWCNGVIGQAWVIEGLRRASVHFSMREAREAARTLAKQLQFDSRYGAWRRLDPSTGPIGVDFTYNHQSWFAAARAEVLSGGDPQVQAFLDKSLESAFNVNEEGVIRHAMGNRLSKRTPTAIAAALRKRWEQGNRKAPGGINVDPDERRKGYHLYVLYSLARLYRATHGNHPLFESEEFMRALQLASNPAFLEGLENNDYAYPYNPPGFEYPMIVNTFSEIEPDLNEGLLEKALEVQERKTLCTETGLFSLGTDDPVTLAARVYELLLGVEPSA